MAHLPIAEVDARRATATNEIIAGAAQKPGYLWYAIVCPCNINCGHMPQHEVPRIMLSRCMYPGELDFFFTQQPFWPVYNFKVRWHCDEAQCQSEQACGAPFLAE